MSLGPALVMNTIGESTEGWFLTSSFPRIGLQISRLPVQLWNGPVQLMGRRGGTGEVHRALSQMGFLTEPHGGGSVKKTLRVSFVKPEAEKQLIPNEGCFSHTFISFTFPQILDISCGWWSIYIIQGEETATPPYVVILAFVLISVGGYFDTG